MKLRNKRTAEINEAEAREDGIYIKANWSKEEKWFLYDLKTLASGWDYYVEPSEPKRYRLIKDLPTFKAGEIFVLENTIEQQGLFRESDDIMAYHQKTLMKFPNILTDWFEEIKPDEPLIRNEKVRRAVNIWLAVQEQPIVEVAITCNKDSDGFFNYTLYGYIEDARMSNGKAVRNNNLTAINFEFRSLEKIEFDINHDYTIKELCGEQE